MFFNIWLLRFLWFLCLLWHFYFLRFWCGCTLEVRDLFLRLDSWNRFLPFFWALRFYSKFLNDLMYIFHFINGYFFCFDKGMLDLFSRFMVRVYHLFTIKTVSTFSMIWLYHFWDIFPLIFLLLHDCKFLSVIQLIDINFSSANTLHNFLLDLLHVRFLSSFDLDLMRGNDLHFVSIYLLGFFLIFFVGVAIITDIILATVTASVVGVALGTSLTDLILLFHHVLLFLAVLSHWWWILALFSFSILAKFLLLILLLLSAAVETIQIKPLIFITAVHLIVFSALFIFL